MTGACSLRACSSLLASLCHGRENTLSCNTPPTHRRSPPSVQCLSEKDRDLRAVAHIRPLLRCGIGIHHSGLLPIIKEVVEILFQEQLIKVRKRIVGRRKGVGGRLSVRLCGQSTCRASSWRRSCPRLQHLPHTQSRITSWQCLFATETFAMGLNMPARTVVFTAMRKWDGTEERWMGSGEYIQMSGRAGRRGKDDRGMTIMMMDSAMDEATCKCVGHPVERRVGSAMEGGLWREGGRAAWAMSNAVAASGNGPLRLTMHSPSHRSPSLCRAMIRGKANPLISSFRLSYYTLLNLMRRVEGSGADAEYVISHSFSQFQHEKEVPALEAKLSELQTRIDAISEAGGPAATEYSELRAELAGLDEELAAEIRNPEHCLHYLRPGRIIRIQQGTRVGRC